MSWILILFFIISILLFVITRYYRLKKQVSIENREAFENESNLTIPEKLLKYHDIKINYQLRDRVMRCFFNKWCFVLNIYMLRK